MSDHIFVDSDIQDNEEQANALQQNKRMKTNDSSRPVLGNITNQTTSM